MRLRAQRVMVGCLKKPGEILGVWARKGIPGDLAGDLGRGRSGSRQWLDDHGSGYGF
jgi:hypothetical protein